jgi:hypothetical protein
VNWERVGQWCELSECGQYTVAAAKIDDRYGFTAFHVKELLGSYRTADEARARCKAHEQTRVEA